MGQYRAWPFQEAEQILKRRRPAADRTVVFQTGFGPSGLPHIGTFGEVARTTWVRRAYEHLTGGPTRLIAFCDDMDGLRKVPLNMPAGDMLAAHLGKPLSRIPDPYGCCDSFSGHMNGKLRDFLDRYGFDYELQSSSQAYGSGVFDAGLRILLQKAEEVRALILPTLREEKRADWSPFFPICPACGSVNGTRVTAYNPERDTVSFRCDGQGEAVGCGACGEVSVLGGHAKVGWKVDWALRWFAYDVDYEMYGKDLIDSASLSGRIVRLMGKQPPAGFFFELFLDEEGKKISKSVGKGLTVDHWVDFAPIESLLFYIYQNPKRAKRLYWGMVPKCVDDYLQALRRYPEVGEEQRPEDGLWHIFDRGSRVPSYGATVDFSAVSNLISAIGGDSPEVLRDFLHRYDPAVAEYPEVAEGLVGKGLAFYREQVLPHKHFRPATEAEKGLFSQVRERLGRCESGEEEDLQAIPFEVARAAGAEARDLFRSFYEVVLGQERGPRFGTFVKLVGKERVLEMLASAAA